MGDFSTRKTTFAKLRGASSIHHVWPDLYQQLMSLLLAESNTRGTVAVQDRAVVDFLAEIGENNVRLS